LLIRHSKYKCHVVKNTLLETAFSAILLTGLHIDPIRAGPLWII